MTNLASMDAVAQFEYMRGTQQTIFGNKVNSVGDALIAIESTKQYVIDIANPDLDTGVLASITSRHSSVTSQNIADGIAYDQRYLIFWIDHNFNVVMDLVSHLGGDERVARALDMGTVNGVENCRVALGLAGTTAIVARLKVLFPSLTFVNSVVVF